ncbi:MAG: 6,7-dimethyl-8-ribityllumazine synthase [Bifidobacteriaceae bacterium]|jgi:6,7-dimethyl-8-ribityllumazine synthase|nr:6,7-dimethyl-8-ribityllumazine synthase [Bifidobacteriaceae bacterium]
MSGDGAPGSGRIDGRGWVIPVVAASWHERIMEGLIVGAMRVLNEAGAEAPLIRVPGSFELPVAVGAVLKDRRDPNGYSRELREGRGDAAVALGVVIRGGTPHFEYVCQAATAGLTQVAIQTGSPVGFGLLTCENEAQALARAGLEGSVEDKGSEAAAAALATLHALHALRGVVRHGYRPER